MPRTNPPRNELAVRMLRGFVKLHRIPARELASRTGIPEGTLGGILSGFQTPSDDRLEILWGAARHMSLDIVGGLRVANQQAQRSLLECQKKLNNLTETLKKMSEQ